MVVSSLQISYYYCIDQTRNVHDYFVFADQEETLQPASIVLMYFSLLLWSIVFWNKPEAVRSYEDTQVLTLGEARMCTFRISQHRFELEQFFASLSVEAAMAEVESVSRWIGDLRDRYPESSCVTVCIYRSWNLRGLYCLSCTLFLLFCL